MDFIISELQFLDLDDVDHSEQDYVKSLLYSVRSPRLELPWVEPEEELQQWAPEQFDGEPEIPGLEAGVPPNNEVFQVPVPVQTTMPQIFQVVSPIPNLPPPYVGNIPHPSMGFYVFSEERTRRPRRKPSPKRTERRDATYGPAPPAVQYSSTAYPIHVAVSSTPYQYLSHPPQHIPSAQHAAGPPLYIPSPAQMPMYPAMYPGYQQVFSPHIPHDDYGKDQSLVIDEKAPTELEEPEKPAEKPPSLPINAIKTTAPPAVPVKKQPPRPSHTQPATVTPPTTVTPQIPVTPPTTVITTTPTTTAQVQAPPPVAPTPVPEGKNPEVEMTWANRVKGDGSRETTVQRKPPISAVAVKLPRIEAKPQLPSVVRPTNPEDPLLKNLGDCLSTYQLVHRAPALTPRGLNNPSNYCYINATLQALLACPAFYNLIKVISDVKEAASGPPPGVAPAKTKTPIIDSMIQFIKEFSPAPQVNRSGRKEKSFWKDKDDLDLPPGSPFEPTYVYKMLHALRNETAFQVEGRQEDAEEFLSLLLNGLNDEMLELVKIVEDPNKETPVINGDITSNGESHAEDSSDWKEVSKGVKSGRITRRAEMGKTPLSEIFRGQLRSRLKKADEDFTDNVQPFFTLQLDIESSESVPEALEKYFGGPDLVEGGVSTAGGGDMWQQHSLEELPNVLILHLKCFHYKQQSCHKIAKALDFPIDLKIESKYVSHKYKSNAKMRQYKLFAVVYHDGKEASKGHYLADAYHVGSGGWVRYDDSVVRSVTEAAVLKPKPPRVPYLLYYRRADTIGQHPR